MALIGVLDEAAGRDLRTAEPPQQWSHPASVGAVVHTCAACGSSLSCVAAELPRFAVTGDGEWQSDADVGAQAGVAVVAEALTNVARYAKATEATIRLDCQDECLVVGAP